LKTPLNKKLFPSPETWPQPKPPPLEELSLPAGITFVELLSGAEEMGDAIKAAGLGPQLESWLASLKRRSKLEREYSAAVALISGNKALGLLAIQREDEPAARIDLSVFEFTEEARESVADSVAAFLLHRADHLIAGEIEPDEESELGLAS
jgi:hypothetical protein